MIRSGQERTARKRYREMAVVLNEQSRRRFVALEARALGRGGVSLMARISGLARSKNTQGAVRYGDRQAGRGLDLGADRAGLPGSLFFGDRNGEPVGEGCPLQTPAHHCSKRARRARS